MTFEHVFETLKNGGKAKRAEWGDEYIQCRDTVHPSHTDMLRAPIGQPAVIKHYVSTDDIMAEDWEVVP